MSRCIRFCCLCLASIGILIAAFSGVSVAAEEKGSYIVVFKEDVAAPAAVAHSQALQHDGKIGFVYSHAIKGYSVELPAVAVTALEHNPKVDYISPDGPVKTVEEEVELETEDNEGPEILEATIPTGISRSFAASNKALDIDGQDDIRANVDVAVIDTGIDQTQPDLNVVARTNCTTGAETCVDNSGTDGNSHGTHVAGTIGALDNGYGVVGVAPGARLWAVKVLNDSGGGSWSEVIAGVDWVDAHASEIEVANMSLGGNAVIPALTKAIEESIKAGVVFVVAAGNSNINVESFTPANVPPAITVSAIADYDGKPGEKSPYTCENYGLDDHRASFSNYGKLIDIAAPGVCILSSKPGSSYGLKSGTSMAAPHVAGAAALLAAKSNPNSMKDVESITATLESTGNYNWVDTSGDGIKEPLLDVSNEKIYALVSAPTVTTGAVAYVGTGSSTESFLTGTVDPKGLSTTYWFEYVEAAKYKPEAENPYAEGAKLPASPATLGGTVDKEYEVKEALTGLKAGTAYDYRIVAENSSGTSKGGNQSFTSLAACKGAEGRCEWSLQTAANPEPQSENELEDVSCASSTMCMAVGNDHYRGKGFSEVWNGSEWKVISTTTGEMKAISCPTTTWCMTVAKSETKGWQLKWVEIFSGSWQISTKSPPTPEGATEVKLNDVSCSSESACTAVGRYYASSEYKPYVARWNGTSWSLQSAPNPTEGDASEAMLSVSCSSSSFCAAVGRAAKKPFAERWNGTEWTRVTAPNPEGATEATLEGISCTSSLWCAAVGNYKGSSGPNKTLTERWNGSSWSVISSPNPGGETYAKLRGVSCLSSSSCIAAGVSYAGFIPSKESTLAESWNGSEWTLQTTPNPEGKTFSSLTAIACSSTTACTAVGKARPESAETNMVTLAERWNGSSWSLQSAANPTPQSENELEDVSCASSTMCMAVGNDHYRSKGFSEVWNGSEWKVLSTTTGEMKAISCPTTTWCMTVAKSEDNGWQLKWVETMSGSWQTTTKSPPTPEGATEMKLQDVSCTSESACTAVGSYKTSEYKPYVARWNGSSWSLQSAPNPTEGDASEAMLSVSCVSSTSCVAVGRAAKKPFAERWNGSEWTRATAPNPEGATEATLEGISCSSSSACMAVGNYKGSSGPNKTLTESWNGSSWSVVASPNPGSETYAKLRSVSCLSSGSCIAAGVNYTGFLPSKESTLAESWNGSEWTLLTTPNPEGKTFSPLTAVSCSSPVACTVVGKAHPELGETNMVTLAERWQ
jgi:subtilisin family serine protease